MLPNIFVSHQSKQRAGEEEGDKGSGAEGGEATLEVSVPTDEGRRQQVSETGSFAYGRGRRCRVDLIHWKKKKKKKLIESFCARPWAFSSEQNR